jgi:hypothetical protein
MGNAEPRDIRLTITQAAPLWRDLSPNMRAKLHQWMARGLFIPAEYHEPRTRRACVLDMSDLVTVAVMHWLFQSGVGFADLAFACRQPGFHTDPTVQRCLLQGPGRFLPALLREHDFRLFVHAFPRIAGVQYTIGSADKPKALIEFPSIPQPGYHHAVHFVPAALWEDHLAEQRVNFRPVPRIVIDCFGIYEDTLRRVRSEGL